MEPSGNSFNTTSSITANTEKKKKIQDAPSSQVRASAAGGKLPPEPQLRSKGNDFSGTTH